MFFLLLFNLPRFKSTPILHFNICMKNSFLFRLEIIREQYRECCKVVQLDGSFRLLNHFLVLSMLALKFNIRSMCLLLKET